MLLKIKQTNYKNISRRYGFFSPNEGPIIARNISPLYTKNFFSIFKELENKQYRVIIYCSTSNLVMFKFLTLSGNSLDIKRFVYDYMLQHEDNRIRR